ncbi:hypothetical protein IQ07DRAFT_426579 [Pyrenochaeta sp. DS3sAY3a]|nr:hypothetical protein IQ07DRAFT_426579 [Pyrenochaeta sp. DS3sAY3a]
MQNSLSKALWKAVFLLPCCQRPCEESAALLATRLICISAALPLEQGSKVPGVKCTVVSTEIKAESTHQSIDMHTHDDRGPYQCHICGSFWADLYLMARHIERCQPKPREPSRDSQFLIELAAKEGAKSTILMVARSSGPTPVSWYMGHEYLAQGIKIWGQSRLDDYKVDYHAPEAEACFLAATNVRTREIPSPPYSEASTAPDATKRGNLHRAWKFTKAIESSLKEMAKHCQSILMSIGSDGFACHAELVLELLKRVPKFTLLVRETELSHGLKEKFFRKSAQGLYYGFFESVNLQ